MTNEATSATSGTAKGTVSNGGGVSSGVYLPPITVRVTEGTTIIHDDVSYIGGDTLEIPTRTAEHLIIAGQVEVA